MIRYTYSACLLHRKLGCSLVIHVFDSIEMKGSNMWVPHVRGRMDYAVD